MILPAPPEDPRPPQRSEYRLWIGNLDPKLTEYTLLKVLQQCNVTLKHFDFLCHRGGPDKGKTRGYCFVTLENRHEAETLIKFLNGKQLLSKRLMVHYAFSEDSKAKVSTDEKSCKVIGDSSSSRSQQKAIHDIEMKLKMMERDTDVSAFLPKSVSNVNYSMPPQHDWGSNNPPMPRCGASRFRTSSVMKKSSGVNVMSCPYSRHQSKR